MTGRAESTDSTDDLAWAHRSTPATWALALAIGAVYALGEWLGPTGSLTLFGRLGALTPDALSAPWRFVSVAFVHSDTAHLALNLVVLIWVGRAVERLLGSARFGVVFAVSTIGGALASHLLTADTSLGASGALWGLIVACAVVVFARGDDMPLEVRAAMRWAAAANLGISVVSSLQPGVDVAAHLGGGLFGGLAMLIPGMLPPRPGDAADPLLRRLGVVSGLMLLAGPSVAIATGQPWRAAETPRLVETPWPAGGLVVPLPEGIAPRDTASIDSTRTTQLFGQPWIDSAVVGIASTAPGKPDPVGNRAALEALVMPWTAQPPEPGFEARGPAHIEGDPPVASIVLDGPDARRLDIAVVALPDRLVRVEVAPTRHHEDQWAGIAREMARGVRVPEP